MEKSNKIRLVAAAGLVAIGTLGAFLYSANKTDSYKEPEISVKRETKINQIQGLIEQKPSQSYLGFDFLGFQQKPELKNSVYDSPLPTPSEYETRILPEIEKQRAREKASRDLARKVQNDTYNFEHGLIWLPPKQPLSVAKRPMVPIR